MSKSLSLNKYVKDAIIEEFQPYPLSYPLNKYNCKKFIDACDEQVKEIVKKIIDNIQHIPFEDFLMNFNISIKELHDLIKDDINNVIILYEFNNEKLKSTYWLTKYFINYMSYLNNNNKIYICDYYNIEHLKLFQNKKYYFVFIDDCSFSGNQIYDKIKHLYECVNYYDIQLNKQSNFIILIPYISKIAINLFTKYLNNLDINDWTILSHIIINKNTDDILSSYDKEILHRYDSLISNNYQKKIYINYNNKILLYFDHKLPDILSTISALFYYGIVFNQLNLKRKKYNLKLEQYPLIKNCEFVKNIDIFELFNNKICPHSPYKEDYEEKIKKYKSIENKSI